MTAAPKGLAAQGAWRPKARTLFLADPTQMRKPVENAGIRCAAGERAALRKHWWFWPLARVRAEWEQGQPSWHHRLMPRCQDNAQPVMHGCCSCVSSSAIFFFGLVTRTLPMGPPQPAQLCSRSSASPGKCGAASRWVTASNRRGWAGESASGSQISTACSVGIKSQPRRAPLRW